MKTVFLSENFQFLEVKFSLYLNRLVFVISISAFGHIHCCQKGDIISNSVDPYETIMCLSHLDLHCFKSIYLGLQSCKDYNTHLGYFFLANKL